MQAVIIAAGESSRFWPLNREHKSQTRLLGRPIIYWTLQGLAERDIRDVVVVCSKGSTIPAMLKNENDLGVKLSFVTQEERRGTGNALWYAKDLIKEPFFVVWPSKVTSGDLAHKILEKQKQENTEIVLVGAKTQTPWDYGVAKFEGDRIVGIHENPEPGQEPSHVKVIGFYYLEPDFFDYYEKLEQHHEADLIEAINLYLEDKKASLVLLENDIPALKYPWELLGILDILIRSEHFRPHIHPSAKIGSNVLIKGGVFIGENTKIQDNTVIEGPCYIGKNCILGHSNVIRGPVNIEDNVFTGAFCEIKHSIIQSGTQLHSGFVGDSIIGENCHIAAGFVSTNRMLDRDSIKVEVKGKKVETGISYLGTVVGEGTHIGIQSGTMPGVCIGSQCVIGPGTLVFENLPDASTLYAKKEQIQKQK